MHDWPLPFLVVDLRGEACEAVARVECVGSGQRRVDAGTNVELDHSCESRPDGEEAVEIVRRWTVVVSQIPEDLLAFGEGEQAIEVAITPSDEERPEKSFAMPFDDEVGGEEGELELVLLSAESALRRLGEDRQGAASLTRVRATHFG